MNRHQKRSLTVQGYWDELAQSPTLGFADEREMLKYLTKEWTDRAIADLLGYHRITIVYRRRRHGIKATVDKNNRKRDRVGKFRK